MKPTSKPADRSCGAPDAAFKEYRSYDSGMGDEMPSLNHDYSSYKKLGVIPYADDGAAAKRIAQERYGAHAQVFATARGWVAFSV